MDWRLTTMEIHDHFAPLSVCLNMGLAYMAFCVRLSSLKILNLYGLDNKLQMIHHETHGLTHCVGSSLFRAAGSATARNDLGKRWSVVGKGA
jgi:hypothetical protein